MVAVVPALIPANVPVTVRGPGLFDFNHGQDGVGRMRSSFPRRQHEFQRQARPALSA